MEATEKDRRRGSRRALLWTMGGVVLVAAAIGVVLVARNASGKGAAANSKGSKKDTASAAAASPVELAAVSKGGISTFLSGTTTLEARNTATLVASRPGRVVELRVEEGQWVEKGAVLARLDDTEARLAVERAEVTAQM